MVRNSVWVVDDDRSIRWVLERALEQEGLEPVSFENADSVLSRLKRDRPDAIISDIRMHGRDGIELLQHVRDEFPDLPVIIMTAHSDLDSAVSSYQSGAFDYLPKPFDVDDAVAMVKRAVSHAQDAREATTVEPESVATEIIGQAPAMQEVFRAIGRLSNSNITVLINGESGTGKESQPGNPRAFVMGGNLVVRWHVAGPWFVALRPEFYWDRNGLWTGAEQFVKAITSTVEYQVPYKWTNTIVRVEHRYEDSTGAGGGFFKSGEIRPGVPGIVPGQHLFLLGGLVSFDSL